MPGLNGALISHLCRLILVREGAENLCCKVRNVRRFWKCGLSQLVTGFVQVCQGRTFHVYMYASGFRIVSCGRGNIRLWRVRNGSIRSCPVNLGEYHSLYFTDVAFEEGESTYQHLDDQTL